MQAEERSIFLAEELRVDPSEVRWFFTADFVDGPVSGLAFYRDTLFRFCCFPEDIPEHHVYVLHELTEDELSEELRIKEKFEALVGTHLSFDLAGKPLPRVLRPRDRWKEFYDTEEIGREIDPCSRPIFAWFDLAPGDSI